MGLVGETGAGKNYHSTFNPKFDSKPPGVIESGMIYLDGENVLEKTEKELEQIRGNDVAMIFQDPMTALNPVMTVGEQIAESIMLHQDVSKAQALEKAKEMLNLVGISESRIWTIHINFLVV